MQRYLEAGEHKLNITAKLDTRVILDCILHFINFLWRLLHGINTRTSLYISDGQQAVVSDAPRRGTHVLVSEAGIFHIMKS
jgi:hypothetical protein